MAAGRGKHENTPKSTGSANGEVRPPTAYDTGITQMETASPLAPETTTAKHHSKLGGAMMGAAAGHMLGGHAILGAEAGALAQHERNKLEKEQHKK
jgi:hypothetical protein